MSVPFASVLMTSLICFRFRYFEIACIFNIGLVWRKLIWLTLVLDFIVFVIAWNSAHTHTHTHTSILYSQCKLRVCLMPFKNLNRFNSYEHWVPKCSFLFLRIDIGDSKHQNIRMNANAFSVGEKYWTKAKMHDMAYKLRNILISCIISSLNVMIKRFQSSYYYLLWTELKIELYSKWKRKSVNLTVKLWCLPCERMNGIHEKKLSRSINPKTDMTRNRNKKESHTLDEFPLNNSIEPTKQTAI